MRDVISVANSSWSNCGESRCWTTPKYKATYQYSLAILRVHVNQALCSLCLVVFSHHISQLLVSLRQFCPGLLFPALPCSFLRLFYPSFLCSLLKQEHVTTNLCVNERTVSWDLGWKVYLTEKYKQTLHLQYNILIKDISTVHRKRDSIRRRKENIMEERKEHWGLNHRYFQHNLVKVLWSRGFNYWRS